MNFKKNFKIGGKKIGLNSRALIIAEISANHNQNFQTTKKLIISAIKNGADVIKIQTYTADGLTLNLKTKDFLIKKDNAWGKDKYLWKLYKRAETSTNLTKKIFKFCKSKKIIAFSSPFDLDTVDLLEQLNCPAYKIASFEMTDLNRNYLLKLHHFEIQALRLCQTKDHCFEKVLFGLEFVP